MNIKIPVQNTIEVVFADISIECSIKVREQIQPSSIEAKMVLDQFKYRLDELAGTFAHRISREVSELLEKGE